MDSSYIAAGAVITQEDKGEERPVLYESVVFPPTESKYSQSRLELCGVTRILKKLQKHICGQHFELLVDAKSLIEMINSPSLPNAPMTRWVAFIQLFLFDLSTNVPGKTFTMPDGLSRRPPDSEHEEPWILMKMRNGSSPTLDFGTKQINTANLGVESKHKGIWKDL